MNIEFTHCPICKQKAVELASNNFIRCALHGWIQESIKEIEIPQEMYLKPVDKSISKYNN